MFARGFEPPTADESGQCSTTELYEHVGSQQLHAYPWLFTYDHASCCLGRLVTAPMVTVIPGLTSR